MKRLCPAARVARLDRDAVRRKGALDALLSRFRDGEIDVLVGTQMIAKGHDFPSVTLVGVISADVGLGMADFRASERTFQLLTQVAGRAGRGEQPGEAIVQTLYPDHYSIQLACRQDYPAFYERELQFRRSDALSAAGRADQHDRARRGRLPARWTMRRTSRRQLREGDGERRELRVLGPAPAPLGRLRGEYRAQLLVKGAEPPADARSAAGGDSPPSRDLRGGRRWTSIRSACFSECRIGIRNWNATDRDSRLRTHVQQSELRVPIDQRLDRRRA